MTVREKTGRRRYILFDIQGEKPLPKEMIILSLNKQLRKNGVDKKQMKFRIIFFHDRTGIVRCSHLFKDHVISMINSMDLNGREAKTLRTSGTLKTLKDWLRERRGIIVPGKTSGKGKKKIGNSYGHKH